MNRPYAWLLLLAFAVGLLAIGGPPVNAQNPQYTVSGTVRDFDGTPLAGVGILIAPSSYRVATSDANGAYSLSLGAGTYYIFAVRSDIPGPSGQLVTVPPLRNDINFTFPQRYTISGTVRDFDGNPLQGVRVEANNRDGGQSTTDASGAYSLAVTAGTYTVRASRSGYPAPAPQEVTVPLARNNVDFTFPQRYTISGVVRDFDGATPIAYASVSITGSGTGSDLTDATGAYSVAVGAGTYTVTVTVNDYLAVVQQVVTVPPARADLNFTLPPRSTIRGTLRDFDGTLLANALVKVERLETGASRTALTNASGVYNITVSTGTYTVTASRGGYPSPPPLIVTLPPDRNDVDFTFPQRYTISGVVRDFGGVTPVESARLSITGGSAASDSDFTDATGLYSFIVSAGTYTITAGKGGYPDAPPQTVSIPPSRNDLNFVLPDHRLVLGDALRLWLRVDFNSLFSREGFFDRRPPAIEEWWNCTSSCSLTWRAALKSSASPLALPQAGDPTTARYALDIFDPPFIFSATLKLRRGDQETILAEWSGNGEQTGPLPAVADNDVLELVIRFAGTLGLSGRTTSGYVGSTLTITVRNRVYLPMIVKAAR